MIRENRRLAKSEMVPTRGSIVASAPVIRSSEIIGSVGIKQEWDVVLVIAQLLHIWSKKFFEVHSLE